MNTAQVEKSEFIVTYPAYSLKSLLVTAESAIGSDLTYHWIPDNKVPESADKFMNFDYYFERRFKLENNHAARHPISYSLLCSVDDAGELSVFVYQRTKQTGEGRLGGKHSIGVGGHVEASDVLDCLTGQMDLFRAVGKSAVREINEEFSYWNRDTSEPVTDLNPYPQMAGYIHGYEGVDNFHLGVVCCYFLPKNIRVSDSKEPDSHTIHQHRANHQTLYTIPCRIYHQREARS